MDYIHATLLIPLLSAIVMAFMPNLRLSSWLNVTVSSANFVVSALLMLKVMEHGAFKNNWFQIDEFNVYLVVLTTFVAMTTSIFSRPYMEHVCHMGWTNKKGMRLYHSMYQLFQFTMLAALTTNNLGVLWISVEGATLATVLLVSLYRTPEAIEAAWKYFMLCGTGIAMALFGTVLLYFAAQHIPGFDAEQGLTWSVLFESSKQMHPVIISIAFVFLLVGYGTKVGLVPLHNWLPDAHSEGPTPMSAVLSGLLLNVALYAVIRMKMIVDNALVSSNHPHLAGYMLMSFGLLSFVVAAFFLHRQRDIKRMFSYSSIEHMGLMTFAFGIGGPLATFAGLFHMLVHSLTKSAIFVTVGHATHISGTQNIEKIRGLIRTQPSVGWPLLLGVAAIAGFPPFGIFTSEFLLLIATMKSWPWLAPILLIGLAIAFAGLFRFLHPMVYGEVPDGQQAVKANMWPVILHLILVLWLGLYIPDTLANWLNEATRFISGTSVL